MKIPEKPPEKHKIKKGLLLRSVFELGPAFSSFLHQMIDENYPNWDEIKYSQPLPGNLSPETVWHLLKVHRTARAQKIPLLDERGNAFTYNLPEMIQKTLHDIDRAAPNKIEAEYPIARETRDKYVISSLMEEAISSSQIEGAATTRQIAKEMLKTGRLPTDTSERMIFNNYAAMEEIQKLKNQELNQETLLRLHVILTKDTLDKPDAVGRFRNPQENVNVLDESDGAVMFTPPPAEKLSERMKALYDFANKEDERFIHPVVKAILLHFWLAYEHPFYDGNGRTARALFYWHMLKNGYWLFEFISISRILLKSPAKYARAFLHTEYDGNDLTYFLIFNVRAIHNALEELYGYLGRKQKESRITVELLRRVTDLNERQYGLLAEALRGPEKVFTIAQHRKESRVVYQTARTDLLGLVERGFFQSQKRGKRFIFIPHQDLNEKIEGTE